MVKNMIRKLYKIIDRLIILPISRIIYNIGKHFRDNSFLNKQLNKPRFIIILSLILAVCCFLIIDNKVISLVETEAETIKNVPVNVIFNNEAFVVENVPQYVDITITGKKSDIYLAKQLGEFSAQLDLSKYKEAGTHKVYFSYSKSIGSVNYILDPSYLIVNIKDKVSEVRTLQYDVVSTDELDEKLSVSSVSLDSTEVIVKGSTEALEEVSTVKALISVSSKDYPDAGTYEMTNIPLVAYNKKGERVENVEITPNVMTGTIILKSYKTTVPLQVNTTGKLTSGKAIASISINNSSSYSIDIYGEEEEIKKITSVPVTINVDGLGNESVKTYSVTINKPSGVRYMNAKNVSISVAFGDEEQKSISINDVTYKNTPKGYTANIVSIGDVNVQVKGVKSNIDKIDASNIKAYVDLTGLTEGTHEVNVKIDNNNPLVSYLVTSTISVKITK